MVDIPVEALEDDEQPGVQWLEPIDRTKWRACRGRICGNRATKTIRGIVISYSSGLTVEPGKGDVVICDDCARLFNRGGSAMHNG